MEFLATLKAFIVTTVTAILAIFGGVDPSTEIVPPIVTSSEVAPVLAEIDPITPELPPAPIPKPTNPLNEIYELGKQIGAIQEQLRQIEMQDRAIIPALTPPPPPVYIPPAPAVIPPPQQPKEMRIYTIEPIKVEIQESVITPPPSMAEIKIISPSSIKGLGRTYVSNPDGIVDEKNYIYIGLIVRDDAGKAQDNIQVVITATDTDQNKTLNGTGALTPIYDDNGVKTQTPFYPFNYEFKTAGQHTITFTANGMTEEVTLSVAEPETE